jgi:hypothetical protein
MSNDLDGNRHFIIFIAEMQHLKAFHKYFMSETTKWISRDLVKVVGRI